AAIDRGLVDVYVFVEEEAHAFHLALADGEEQGREAADFGGAWGIGGSPAESAFANWCCRAGSGGEIGSAGGEQLQDIGVALLGSPHRSGCAAKSFLCVGLSAGIEQCFDGGQVAGSRGNH